MPEDKNNLFQPVSPAKGPVIDAKYEVIDPPTLKAGSGTPNNGGVLRQGGASSRKDFFDRVRRHPATTAGVIGFSAALLTGSLSGGPLWGAVAWWAVQGALAYGAPSVSVAMLHSAGKHIGIAYSDPFPKVRAAFNEAKQTFQANRMSSGGRKASVPKAAWNGAMAKAAQTKAQEAQEQAANTILSTDTTEQIREKVKNKALSKAAKVRSKYHKIASVFVSLATLAAVGGAWGWAIPAGTKNLVENIGLKAPLLVNVNNGYDWLKGNPSSHIEAFNTPHPCKHGLSKCFQKKNIYRTPNLDYGKLNEKDRTPVGQTIPGEEYNVTYNDLSKGFDQITIEQPGKRPLKLYVRDRAFTHEK